MRLNRWVRGAMAACLCVAVIAVVAVAMNSYRQSTKEPVSSPGVGQGFFDGTVMEISENTILVKCIRNYYEDEIPVGTDVTVSLDTISDEKIPSMQIGDTVRVLHLGVNTDISPAMTLETISIFLLDENGEPVLASSDNYILPACRSFFNGTVTEISEHTVLVKCIKSYFGDISVGTEVIVSLDTTSDEEVPSLQNGDNIRILHMGINTDTSPATLEETVAIIRVDQYGKPDI